MPTRRNPFALDTETREILVRIGWFYDLPKIREKSLHSTLTPEENALLHLVENVGILLEEHRSPVWRLWRRWVYRMRAWGRGGTYVRLYPNPGVSIGTHRVRVAVSVLGGIKLLRSA